MKNIKAPKLTKHNQIGLISNSAPLAGLVPHRTKRGIEMLRALGFKVKLGISALKVDNYIAGSPEERAKDINSFIKNKNIKAILSFIGGDHSSQLLPLLNFEQIKNNPKIIMGFSDTTVLLLAIYSQTGLVTFYGPSVLNQFAENPKMLDYTMKYFKKAVMSNLPIGKIIPSPLWTEEMMDWFEKKDILRPRKMKKNSGWLWLKDGKAEGPLIGGCLFSLMHLRGTKYWPEFKGTILFWEISENDSNIFEGEAISAVDSHLIDLENSGVFEEISGMVIGRPYHYSKKMEKRLISLVKERTKKFNFPILYRVDFGHTDPMITLPIGAKSTLDSKEGIFAINESGVK
jgi:muramoyltetrapeptide carboxypeptidase